MPDDPFSAAAHWIEALIFGRVSVIVATLAIAYVGLQLLGGRLAPRRGAIVIVGLFVMLGAPAIARELVGLAPRDGPPPSANVFENDEGGPIAPPMPSDDDRSPYSRSSVG